MNGEVSSLVALKMRKLVAEHGAGSVEFAEAMRHLLEGQRQLIQPGGSFADNVAHLPSRALRAVK